MEKAIYAHLSTSATIIGVVSSRIYVSILPENITYPALMFTRVTGEPINALQGFTSAENVQIQIDCFSTSYKTAYELSTAVHTVMGTAGTYKSLMTINQDMSQTLDDMTRIYRINQQYSCWKLTT